MIYVGRAPLLLLLLADFGSSPNRHCLLLAAYMAVCADVNAWMPLQDAKNAIKS